jgi:hypothetical protein
MITRIFQLPLKQGEQEPQMKSSYIIVGLFILLVFIAIINKINDSSKLEIVQVRKE